LANLYSPLININKTHILQEYFIPIYPASNFIVWMNYLRKIFKKINKCINLLNITIRYVKQDNVTFLKYAQTDVYAFVFYYRIDCNTQADKLKKLHNKLTNKILELNGTFYLPYRHHYSYTQLKKAYPNIYHFFILKKKYDSIEMFSNMWYEKYKFINSF